MAATTLAQCQANIHSGKRWVVDMDLEKFFDRVDHDTLMSRLARTIKDERLLKLIRRYLAAELDGWIRRKLRCLLWRQWKRPFTRARKLMKAGLDEVRAWRSACNQRGAWWNSGASHMDQDCKNSLFNKLGLVSLLECHRQFQC